MEKIYAVSDNFHGLKILILELDDIHKKVTKHLLEQLGCEVKFVDSSESLLCSNFEKYNVVFINVLPDMKEIELLKDVKRTHAYKSANAKVPIIAYTACGSEVVRKCLDEGFDDVIEEPAMREYFARILRKWALK